MESKFLNRKNTRSDINEHLEIMRNYALQCSHITEMGVRGIVSLWAWLDAKPSVIRAYDVVHPPKGELEYVYEYAQHHGIDFTFELEDVLHLEIEPTELLFIDTIHWYSQLIRELTLHAPKTSRYIVLHDTTTFRTEGVGPNNVKGEGMQKAIDEFLEANPQWTVKEEYTHNNGLMILERQ